MPLPKFCIALSQVMHPVENFTMSTEGSSFCYVVLFGIIWCCTTLDFAVTDYVVVLYDTDVEFRAWRVWQCVMLYCLVLTELGYNYIYISGTEEYSLDFKMLMEEHPVICCNWCQVFAPTQQAVGLKSNPKGGRCIRSFQWKYLILQKVYFYGCAGWMKIDLRKSQVG